MRREYLRRVRLAFDREGIEIAFPQVTVRRPAAKATDGPSGETTGQALQASP